MDHIYILEKLTYVVKISICKWHIDFVGILSPPAQREANASATDIR